MIWVAWRQFRAQALVTLGLLAALAVLVLVTGLHLRDVYSSLGGAHCGARNDCTALGGHDKQLADLLGPALLAIPALLGMFWGAPLVARELESGTYRLAWTQSVTRRRWLSVRVVLVGGAALAVAGLASWLVSWWFAPLDAVNMNRFAPSVFTTRGIVAIGYTGFAFALGVATGTLARRTLPAMAAMLLGFVAARIAVTFWIRPHLLPAKQIATSVALGKGVGFVSSASGVSIAPGSPPIPNAWMISAALVDRAHHALSAAQLHDLLARTCPAIVAGLPPPNSGAAKNAAGPASSAVLRCQVALSHHVQQLVVYQPRSHYWPLQALGGISRAFLRPSYQSRISGLGAYRGVPDVAATAAPHTALAWITSTGDGKYTLEGHGGTSASAPLWAGLIALADQLAGRHLGFVNAGLYRIGRNAQYHQAFHDVTAGSNTVRFPPRTISGYHAAPGWDPITGWGSPNATVLIPLLARYVHPDDGKGL